MAESVALTKNDLPALDPKVVESVVLGGDLSKLTPEARLAYYSKVCESLGLNPLTKPFEFILLNGKLQMYARRDCTEQLRKIHGVSITDLSSRESEGVFIVTVKGSDKSGRTDASTGAVPIAGLKGEALSNAVMKAETKAKRRLTLSLCGLGMLDESEADSIPGATPQPTTVNEEWPPKDGPIGKAPGKAQDAPPASKAPAAKPAAPKPLPLSREACASFDLKTLANAHALRYGPETTLQFVDQFGGDRKVKAERDFGMTAENVAALRHELSEQVFAWTGA